MWKSFLLSRNPMGQWLGPVSAAYVKMRLFLPMTCLGVFGLYALKIFFASTDGNLVGNPMEIFLNGWFGYFFQFELFPNFLWTLLPLIFFAKNNSCRSFTEMGPTDSSLRAPFRMYRHCIEPPPYSWNLKSRRWLAFILAP